MSWEPDLPKEDMDLFDEMVNGSTTENEVTTEMEETESVISADEKILQIEDVWPILEKMGCRHEGDNYYLPKSCAQTDASGDAEQQAFDSDSLRRYLCQFGMPTCSRTPTAGLDDDEELLFKRWVRYSIVPFPSNLVIMPDYGETSHQQVKTFFQDRLHIPFKSGFFTFRDKKLELDCLMKVFALEGIDWGAYTGLDANEVCKIMMCIAENKDLETFACCSYHRPTRMVTSTCPPPPRVSEPSEPQATEELLVSNDPFRREAPPNNGTLWDRLGSTRCSPDNFSWGGIIGWRKGLGRTYFGSFKLNGMEFSPGDFVARCEKLESGTLVDEIFQVISAFQAMKSWVGKWNNDKNELQKRGHCYLELQRYKEVKGQSGCALGDKPAANTLILDKTTEPTVPCWFLDERYTFQKLHGIRILLKKRKSNKIQVCEPPAIASPEELADRCAAWRWDQSRHAVQVKFANVAQSQRSSSQVSNGLPVYDDESCDDSDGESEELNVLDIPVKRQIPRKLTAPNNIVTRDWFPASDPLPQIVVENLNFEACKDEIGYAELKKDLAVITNFVGKYEGAPEMVEVVKLKLWQAQPLSKLVELNPTMDSSLKPKLQSILEQLGFQKFRNGQQQDVCLASLECPSEDIMFVAPCGFGKSMCFVLPAIMQGGVTLVIEPLRTLVDDLVHCLKGEKGKSLYDVEALKNFEDSQRNNNEPDYADHFLWNLASHCEKRAFTGKPLILIVVAELVNKQSNLGFLNALASRGALRRIVVDEFDVIEESSSNYRETYTSLVPNIRDACQGVPIMFLSGTTTKCVMLKVLASPESNMTKVFTHARALPDNLVFSVERKIDNTQVANRILSILRTYLNESHDYSAPLKVLCCCLTRPKCEEMKKLLLLNCGNLEMFVEIVTSDTNKALKTPEITRAFRERSSKAVHILCVTKALGRGFHADDIRFVFHTNVPVSPSNYIQEAGRAGRGCKHTNAFCILFFREQDCAQAANVTSQYGVTERTQFNKDELHKVIQYCRAGDLCRYSILASYATLPECKPWNQKCHRDAQCDNCRQHPPFQSKGPMFVAHKDLGQLQLNRSRQNITELIKELLRRYEYEEKASHRVDAGRKWPRSDGDRLTLGEKIWNDCLDRFAVSELSSVLSFGSQAASLSSELYRFLAAFGIIQPGCSNRSLQMFLESNFRVFIKNSRGIISTQDKSKVMDLELCAHHVCLMRTDEKLPSHPVDNWSGMSFLLQFERQRVRRDGQDLSENFSESLGDIQSLPLGSVLERLCQKKPPYLDVIQRAVSAGEKVDEGVATHLFFSARIPTAAKSLMDLELLPPEPASDRRIFRKFGSHRFLHINVPSNVAKDVRRLIFSRQHLSICGRQYSLLWAKHTKSPQVYVLFAEKGVGLKGEISAQQVLEWCLCPKANPNMTLGRLVKRMKLCFSKTTASGVLPEGSVELFPDIKSPDGSIMTDGCGLVSERALAAIWDVYWREFSCQGDSDPPAVKCTSFQGRLGGFKGTWVLSRSLGDSFKIVCTESQLKFNLPMKCMKNCAHKEGWDDAYDTMDVCRWNMGMQEATLNNRLIQCLESRAVGENYVKLLDFLQHRVQETCQRLTELKDPEKWVQFALKKNRQTPQDEEKAIGCTDTKMLLEMSIGGIEHTDPTFARRRKRLLGNEFKNMRKKGHYPIENARYVWIFPDFSGLLEEGEAYLALGNEELTSDHILALRSPSYFAEDLRKLRLVGIEELSHRKPWEEGRFGELPLPDMAFLLGLQNALILSTKGMRPEAGKMSGGDHDGDICWVCWNDELIPLVEPSKDGADLSFPEPEKSVLEQKNAWQSSQDDMLDFIYHHRGHQSQLGSLANLLDKAVDEFGFDHEYACEIGRQAFLQVDHPYNICKPPQPVTQAVQKLPCPHWMEQDRKEPSKRSNRALGILWDIVESNLNLVVNGNHAIKPDSRITNYVHSAADNLVTRDLVSDLRTQMRRAIRGWLVEKDMLKGARVNDDPAQSTKREKYLQKQQKELIWKQSNDVVDRRGLAAAVLYEQAHQLPNDNYKDLVQDVTWMLGLRWLVRIVGDGDSGENVPPMTVKDDYAGFIFNKRRRT